MAHQTPADGAACACCFDDLSSENYVEYRVSETAEWLACKYCQTCTETIQGSQYQTYLDNVEKATCAAALRRLLTAGPPLYLKDKEALPVPEGADVVELWYASDGQIHSAKLPGAPEGAARDAKWEELKAANLVRLDTLPDTTELEATKAE